MKICWTYDISHLHETFLVEAEDIATLLELRSAILDTASRLAHNDAVLLGDVATIRCDICDTWVATHTVDTGNFVTYNVCDKPRCKDRAEAIRKERMSDANTESIQPDQDEG